MSARRVVLLARAGGARDRSEIALRDAGTTMAGAFDPGSATLDEVQATGPGAVLVLLEAALEHELDRFAPLLHDDRLVVVYEDADVAARREGWDTARWARHLRAKLQGHDEVLPRVGDPPDPASHDAAFAAEMEQIQRLVEALPELQMDRNLPSEPGAVVVAAGTGGPDAVRQLLAALPAAFPRPILLRQRIAGGQYDRLVRQMDRVTDMPVRLAQAGEAPRAGHVHVVPDGLGVQRIPGGLRFVEDDAPGLAALNQADSALLLLSGADVALVDAAMAMRWAGGLALAQSRDHNFDPAAGDALVARGGEALGLAALSRQLLERWPA